MYTKLNGAMTEYPETITRLLGRLEELNKKQESVQNEIAALRTEIYQLKMSSKEPEIIQNQVLQPPEEPATEPRQPVFKVPAVKKGPSVRSKPRKVHRRKPYQQNRDCRYHYRGWHWCEVCHRP